MAPVRSCLQKHGDIIEELISSTNLKNITQRFYFMLWQILMFQNLWFLPELFANEFAHLDIIYTYLIGLKWLKTKLYAEEEKFPNSFFRLFHMVSYTLFWLTVEQFQPVKRWFLEHIFPKVQVTSNKNASTSNTIFGHIFNALFHLVWTILSRVSDWENASLIESNFSTVNLKLPF